MPYRPGVSGNPAGKPKGAMNKSTIEVKRAIELAFEGIGGVKALTAWAKENPTHFYNSVWSKIIPKDINLEGAGGLTMLFNFSEIVRSLKNVSTEDILALERAASVAIDRRIVDAETSGGNGQAEQKP